MRAGWLLLLALAGCGRTPSVPELYQQAGASLLSEQYPQALATAELGARQAAPGSPWDIKFRLLEAKILLAQQETKKAQAVLNFQIPAGTQWDEDRARYQLYLGRVAFSFSKFPEAEARLHQAQALTRSAGAPALLTESKLLEMMLAARTGKFGEAESLASEVIDYGARHDVYLQMKASGNMGFIMLRSARYEEAVTWLHQALGAFHSLHLPDSEGRATGNLGWCYYRLGDFDQALQYSQKAVALSQQAEDRSDWKEWLDTIGSIYLDRHDYPAAAAAYQQALAIARSLDQPSAIAFLLNNLALVSMATGDWDSAERYNNEALDIKRAIHDKQAELYSLANAARIAAGRKDYARAEQTYQAVIHSPSVDPVPLLDAHAGLAQVLAETHRARQAETEFQAAIAILDHRQEQLSGIKDKLTYLEVLIHFYQDYVDFLMERGRPRDALEAAESSRAHVLAGKLNVASARPGHTAADFQKLAATFKSTLLSYWVAPAKSYLWAVTPAGIAAYSLPPEAALRSLAANYDALIQGQRDPLQVENPAGQKLYDALLAPAGQLVAKTGRVIVVPNGSLYSINFETLPVTGTKPHYFIEDATVSVTPALTLLSPAHPGGVTHSLLLIGNPVPADARYPRLAFADKEISAIRQNMSGFRTVALQGAEARPQAYAASDPGRFSLIHFAAHASADRVDPLQSAVILSPFNATYTLRAADVMQTPLQADLVTVSACRSAGARIYGGEGLVGFAWAFLEAGAHNVIAGLWDVDDRSTADLMAGLYQNLARGAPPADALRAAKLQLLHSTGVYRKPYYWGPFQVFTRSR